MKKTLLISAIALSGLIYNTANAQIRIHLGLNFAPRHVYVPERVVVRDEPVAYSEPSNYDGDEDYYYLPEVDSYYSVTDECYYYNDGTNWVSATYLPGAYRNYNWREARRYEVHAPRPFMHNDYYRARYNGVAFNSRWNRGYNAGYTNGDRFENHELRNHGGRSENDRNWNNYNHHFDENRNWNHNQRMDQSRNFDRMSAQQHFAQRGDLNSHRQGRF